MARQPLPPSLLLTTIPPVPTPTARSAPTTCTDRIPERGPPATALQFAPAFFLPLLAARRRTQTGLLVALVAVAAAALAGLLAAPGAAVVWMAALGLAQGGALGLALMLPVLRGRDAHAVGSLTAMALSVGYLVAAAGPWLAGLAHDLTGGWTAPLVVLIGITVAELAVGVPATRAWRAG